MMNYLHTIGLFFTLSLSLWPPLTDSLLTMYCLKSMIVCFDWGFHKSMNECHLLQNSWATLNIANSLINYLQFTIGFAFWPHWLTLRCLKMLVCLPLKPCPYESKLDFWHSLFELDIYSIWNVYSLKCILFQTRKYFLLNV